MGKLLKYEMRKTWMMKLIIFGITAVLELAFVATLYLQSGNDHEELLATLVLLLMFMAIGGVILIGVQSVMTLHRDMNTKQGYMLYLTPRNSFQILGAKMLENGISLVLAGTFFFLLGLLDVTLLFSKLGRLEALWDMAQQFMSALNSQIQLNTEGVLCLVVDLLVSWLATVSIAYLADIISSALLNGKRFNGLVTFVLFILLSMLLSRIQRLFVGQGMYLSTQMLAQAAVALVYSAIMYVASAFTMEKYLSV